MTKEQALKVIELIDAKIREFNVITGESYAAEAKERMRVEQELLALCEDEEATK